MLYDEHARRSMMEVVHTQARPTDSQLIRPFILEKLKRYRTHHEPTGGFLEAVLSNNLKEAIMRADEGNLVTLPAIVSYCYNQMPSLCWGSCEAYEAWVSKHRNTTDVEPTGTEQVSDATGDRSAERGS